MALNDVVLIAQGIGVLISVWGTFSALRARDNERAAKLGEIKTEIRYLIMRIDRLERESRKNHNRGDDEERVIA
ncbi:MAG: hypothetical protein IJC48_01170 [Clostridia bacterium]|nr:hypothetical protein [Clostridia bacterium]